MKQTIILPIAAWNNWLQTAFNNKYYISAADIHILCWNFTETEFKMTLTGPSNARSQYLHYISDVLHDAPWHQPMGLISGLYRPF